MAYRVRTAGSNCLRGTLCAHSAATQSCILYEFTSLTVGEDIRVSPLYTVEERRLLVNLPSVAARDIS